MFNNENAEIHIRVTAEQKKQILRTAKRCGMTLSAFARARLFGYEPKGLAPESVAKFMAELYRIHDAMISVGQNQLASELRNVAVAFQKSISDPEERTA